MTRKTASIIIIMSCVMGIAMLTAGCSSSPPIDASKISCTQVQITEKMKAVDGNYYVMGDTGIAYRIASVDIYNKITANGINNVKVAEVGGFQKIVEVC